MASASSERELLKRFEVQKFLGKGSYGSVCVGRRDARTGARAMRRFFASRRGTRPPFVGFVFLNVIGVS
jgi:hypothetical protein